MSEEKWWEMRIFPDIEKELEEQKKHDTEKSKEKYEKYKRNFDEMELELFKVKLKLESATKNLKRMVKISEILQDEPYCLMTSKRALEEIDKI